MANYNHIKTFTAYDIEKYHTGKLSPKEMHALEKAALEDPFLADAIAGYATQGINVSADIAELKKRLADKAEETKVMPVSAAGRFSFPWLRAAVILVVIAGAGLLSYQFLFRPKTTDIAQAVQKENEPVKAKEPISTPPQENIADTLPESKSTTILSNPDNKTRPENIAIKQNTQTKEAIGTAGAVSENAKTDIVTTDFSKDLPVTTKAPAKTDEIADTEKRKSLRNDNIAEKSSVSERKVDYKEKELSLKKKDEINADVAAENRQGKEAPVTPTGVTYNNGNSQANPDNAINYFRGKITDANNNALPFANITNTTDNVGTYSDAKGNFTLVSSDSVLNVQVRSLGFENKNTKLRNNTTNNQVVMLEDRNSLTEIVVNNKKINSNRNRDTNMKFEEPEPADGWESYDTYIANNLNIPESIESKKPGARNEVELSFEVNKEGEPINIRIEKSLCDKCDREAIRLIKEGPKWKRKAKKGKRTTVSVPFN